MSDIEQSNVSAIQSPSAPEIALHGMTATDWPSVRAIYAEGIATGNATFETSTPEWEKWDAGHLKSCRLVAQQNNDVIGWAALSGVSSRCVYAGVAEVSVYVAERARGLTIGSKLLEARWPLRSARVSGPCRQGFFPRTSPASKPTSSAAFAWSASASGWAASMDAGAMWC